MKKRLIITLSILLIVIISFGACTSCKKTKVPEKEISKYVSFTISMGDKDSFKILQLTDTHFINSEETDPENLSKDYSRRDGWAKTAIAETVQAASPDLIIVTGDSIFTLNEMKVFTGTSDNYAAFQEFALYIDSFKIPWAFLFGNHDEEGSLMLNLGSAKETKKILGAFLNSDEIKYCKYSDGPDEINGVGNYIINIVNKDGSVNHPLVLFDSGSYLRVVDPRDGKTYANQQAYEYVHDDQLDWYETAITDISRIEGKPVESIIFQHIPFPEYGTVYDAFVEALVKLGENPEDTIKPDGTGVERTLETKLGTVTYHGGIYGDGAVASSYVGEFHGKTYDGGHEFERLVKFGSAKYVFCGHDHRNTFAFTYKGIRFGYSRSIDYSANGLVPPPLADNQTIYDETVQRGGTLITLGKDNSVNIESIPFTRNLYRETLEELGLEK